MLALLLALSLGAPPRGKPVVPVVFVQRLLAGPALGPELTDSPTPTLELGADDDSYQWLAVEVWATTGGAAGESKPEPVQLTVKQGKRTHVLKSRQRSENDTESVPFFVPIEGCDAIELSAKVGARKAVVVKLAVQCGR